jgi:hypothetical protein
MPRKYEIECEVGFKGGWELESEHGHKLEFEVECDVNPKAAGSSADRWSVANPPAGGNRHLWV